MDSRKPDFCLEDNSEPSEKQQSSEIGEGSKKNVQTTEDALFNLDVAFMIDCTGSMQPYIDMAREKVREIIATLKSQYSDAKVRIAILGYRDIRDKKRFEGFQFSKKIDEATQFLQSLQAGGGDDTPEDVNGGLQRALDALKWKSPTRILYHLSDAPCHGKEFHNCPNDDFPSGYEEDKSWETLFK